MQPQPLVLEPIVKEKVWGGRRLAGYNKPLPESDVRVGESWELVDLTSTSPDGGGGGAACSRIASGESRGLTLRDATRAMGVNLLGRVRLTEDGGFPLLVKYLDASENLSVQVHPSAEYATEHPSCSVKTETWVVLAAEAGSLVYHGLAPGTTREAFEASLGDGTVVDLLNAIPARVGDVHHLPSGTVHALGAGVLVAEVQSPSDTTFRVYDWGRSGRALHVEQALSCIDFEASACGAAEAISAPVASADRLTMIGDGVRLGVVEANELYELAGLEAQGGHAHEVNTALDAPVVLMFTAGEGHLESTSGTYEPVAFRSGDTVLVPARLDSVRVVFARDTSCLVVRMRES